LGIEVAPIEMLSARDRIVRTVVRVGNGPEDELGLAHELRAAEGKVQKRARVEDDDAAIGVTGAWVVERHPKDATRCLGWDARSTPRTNARKVAPAEEIV
jgi:hypothetical protein